MSVSRECCIYKATDDKWYLLLGDFEYAYDEEDCTTYGPFVSEEKADRFLSNNFSNPGGLDVDDSGESEPPKNPVSRKGYIL